MLQQERLYKVFILELLDLCAIVHAELYAKLRYDTYRLMTRELITRFTVPSKSRMSGSAISTTRIMQV